MKNKTFRISLVVVLLAVVTISVISGTLAKYVETVTGTDTARVAKFSYKAKIGETEFTDGATINLFNTVNDTEVYGAQNNINGGTKLIAPGTHGSFSVVVENTSEVKVGVSFTVTETNNSNIPIVYYIDNSGTKTYYSDVVTTNSVAVGADLASTLGVSASATVAIAGGLDDLANTMAVELAATDGTEANKTTSTATIGWFWAFGDGASNNDSGDTTIGKAGTATLTSNIGVTFTQMD